MSRDVKVGAWITFAGAVVAALIGALANRTPTTDVRVDVTVPSAPPVRASSDSALPVTSDSLVARPDSPVTPAKSRGPASDGAEPRSTRSQASLLLDYDSLAARLDAVSNALSQRAEALNGLPIKREIAAALESSRRDLAAAKTALAEHSGEGSKERLDRVREALKYLESL